MFVILFKLSIINNIIPLLNNNIWSDCISKWCKIIGLKYRYLEKNKLKNKLVEYYEFN